MREWLKALRAEKFKSQTAAAKEIGITSQMYNFIENGERRPSVETAKKIAAVLGFDWRLFYPDEPENRAG